MRKLFILLLASLVINFIKAQNVGIGIVTPHATLHLHQTNFPTLLFTNSTTGSLSTDGTALLVDGNNFVVDNGENADIIIKTNLAERMRITGSGYVGIGTATPNLAQLQVEGMVGNTVAMFKGSAGSKGISFIADWPGIFFNSYFNGGVKAMSASGYPSFINTEQTTGALTFNTTDVPNTIANDPVTVPERMRIAGNGYVGIGTVSPNYHLQLHNTTSNTTSLQITNNAGGSTFFDGALITQENDDLTVENLEGAGKIYFKNGGVPRMTITSTGLVGINQLNPISPLDVSGPIRVNDGNQGEGKVLTSDALGNGSWKMPPGREVAFWARMSNELIVNGLNTTVVFDSTFFNKGNGYDKLTGIFTAPSEGLYYFHVGLSWYTSNLPHTIGFVIVGNNPYTDVASTGEINSTMSDFFIMATSAMIYLSAGETVHVRAFEENTGTATITYVFGSTHFFGYKIY